MFNHCRNQMNQNRIQTQIHFHFLQHRLQLKPSLQQLVLQRLVLLRRLVLLQQLGRQLERPLLWLLLELQQLLRQPLEPRRPQLSFRLIQPPLAWLRRLQIQRLHLFQPQQNLLLLLHLRYLILLLLFVISFLFILLVFLMILMSYKRQIFFLIRKLLSQLSHRHQSWLAWQPNDLNQHLHLKYFEACSLSILHHFHQHSFLVQLLLQVYHYFLILYHLFLVPIQLIAYRFYLRALFQYTLFL